MLGSLGEGIRGSGRREEMGGEGIGGEGKVQYDRVLGQGR